MSILVKFGDGLKGMCLFNIILKSNSVNPCKIRRWVESESIRRRNSDKNSVNPCKIRRWVERNITQQSKEVETSVNPCKIRRWVERMKKRLMVNTNLTVSILVKFGDGLKACRVHNLQMYYDSVNPCKIRRWVERKKRNQTKP